MQWSFVNVLTSNTVWSDDCISVNVSAQNMAALSSSDAEFMLAMSRTYGSLPLMGGWPTHPPTTSAETAMKTLETSQQTGPTGVPYNPAASHVSHISDSYMQALIAR